VGENIARRSWCRRLSQQRPQRRQARVQRSSRPKPRSQGTRPGGVGDAQPGWRAASQAQPVAPILRIDAAGSWTSERLRTLSRPTARPHSRRRARGQQTGQRQTTPAARMSSVSMRISVWRCHRRTAGRVFVPGVWRGRRVDEVVLAEPLQGRGQPGFSPRKLAGSVFSGVQRPPPRCDLPARPRRGRGAHRRPRRRPRWHTIRPRRRPDIDGLGS
jgi:hypothetical protein